MLSLSRFRTLLLPLLAMLLVGCGSDSLAPYEPEIHNNADKFELQATGVADLTRTYNYKWNNSGTAAAIDHSTAATKGSVTLVVLDAADVMVYGGDLALDGVFDTAVGQAGEWTIRVIFDDFSGTVNFSAEKK